MKLAAAGSGAGAVSAPVRLAASAVPFICAAAIAVVVATRVTAPSIGLSIGVAVGLAVAVWMFFTERMELPLVVLLLYLGLLDGYLKLKTNSSLITIGRDALLYAILLGFLVRAMLRRQPLRLPPLSGWVLAFTAVVLVQAANPASQGLVHTIGALRPHLEFVPLFFVGYYMVQTVPRLRTFFVIMLVIATANGIVSTIQLNLTPAQLASWGPGYAFRINGGGTGLNHVSGRIFQQKTGTICRSAQCAAHAALRPRRRRRRRRGVGDAGARRGDSARLARSCENTVGRMALLLCIGPPLAIITGEGRALLIGSSWSPCSPTSCSPPPPGA